MKQHARPPLPTPEIAWARVLACWRAPSLPAERVPLPGALGRVTASAVRSPLDMPPFDRTAMDGYAVRAADLVSAHSRPALIIVGEVPMGRAATQPVEPGQAIWVATGSMIPPGADAVVNVERTQAMPGGVEIVGPVRAGDNTIARGAHTRAGGPVLGAGHRLRPQDIAALASVGLPDVLVVRQPRVAILVTGDELRLPGERLEPGEIYTSNGYALAAQVAQAGGLATVSPLIPDDLTAISGALHQARAQAEVILLSGGSSVGRKDLTAQALEAAGAAILVSGVAAKPGRPTIVATIGDRLVVGIPGNPMAAMIAFLMFGRPALARLLRVCQVDGYRMHSGPRIPAQLAEDVVSQQGRQEYFCVRLQHAAKTGWLAVPVCGTASSLAGMVDSDGLLVVPPDVDRVCAGEEVEVTIY